MNRLFYRIGTDFTEGYWKKGNVDILCEMNGIYLFHTKDEFLDYIENLKWK